ncbi:CapA family protein [Halobacterium sp. R2-5]|uniref:CapA family protein n=1 Tax=Halobacterium sp. R2-5 TaxID=2715751 RepID=UPI00141EB818|nr:CapA family protein [Halobacterium sp. R2-5]NIC01012.1 CapA family protein [Halobacterium sp. R2-5]
MPEKFPRREFVRLSSTALAGSLAGCGALQSSDSVETQTTTPAESEPPPTETQPVSEPIEGRVFSLSGEPLTGARVSATARNVGTVAETTTNEHGRFRLESTAAPVWVRVSASNYIGRTVAATPDTPLRVELTPREGAVSMSFGGDVMFGRRFYQSEEDTLSSHFRIRPGERRADHREILSYIRPLLQEADVTSVNLETPLTTSDWRHAEKQYLFVSHPVAASSLSDAGVDYTALGNNHVFDALTPGLRETREALDEAGIAYSGAGESSEQAWEPAYLEREGLTIGLISCTTITGSQYDIDWSADEDPESYPVTRDADGDGQTEELRFSGTAGAADANEERLERRVSEAAENADVTVVQIHGGTEYQRIPTAEIERLTETASTAGADLVINHHPHVTGGLEFRGSTLVAWSLGNLVFDQEFWETYPSYLLTVHATENGVRRAYFDPLLLEGYVPKGIVAEPALSQSRRTAGLSSEQFTLHQSRVQYLRDTRSDLRTEQQQFEGEGTVFARESGWVRSIVDGVESVELGTDRLPTGSFENPDVDDDEFEASLWRFGRHDDAMGEGIGRDDSGGIRLIRDEANSQRAILSPLDRIPVQGPITLTGLYQHDSDARLEVLWRRYSSTSGEMLEERTYELGRTGTRLNRFRENFQRRDSAEYVDFYLRLYPPEEGESAARFDELRLIEWSDAREGREYDHLRVSGSATAELAQVAGRTSPDVNWVRLGETD